MHNAVVVCTHIDLSARMHAVVVCTHVDLSARMYAVVVRLLIDEPGEHPLDAAEEQEDAGVDEATRTFRLLPTNAVESTAQLSFT